ncbi:MAG: YfhO family protein, partial [Chloroflexota bacterium]
LALWIPFVNKNRQIIFWGGVAALTLLISFGGNTFLYSPLYLSIPGFSIFRGQERWAFATAFSLCTLVGYGFHQLLIIQSGKTSVGQKDTIIVDQPPITYLITFTKYLFFFGLLLTFLFFYGLNDTGWGPESPFHNLLNTAILLTILLLLGWLLWRAIPYFSPTLLTILVAALISFDLFTANWQTNLYPELPEWHTQMPALVAAIKVDAENTPSEPYRVYNEFRIYDNYGIPFEIEDLWGASPLRPDRYDKFLAPPMPLERSWQLLNVKYVITWRQELFVPSTVIHQEPAADGTTYVHRLGQVAPRAWLVTQSRIADDAAILETLGNTDFDPFKVALLEAEAAKFNTISTTDLAEDNSLKIKTFVANSPQSLTVQTQTNSPALLVLSEPHYPGWQASIDGEAAPLLRANYILRAVPVPEGTHTIKLQFRPFSFTLGAIITGITLILVGGLIINSRTARRGRF